MKTGIAGTQDVHAQVNTDLAVFTVTGGGFLSQHPLKAEGKVEHHMTRNVVDVLQN